MINPKRCLTFQEEIAVKGDFLYLAELVNTRGVITEPEGQTLLELASLLADDHRINAISITDNAGGNAMLAPDILGSFLQKSGQNVIIHLSCKDWNRNAIQSQAWKLSSDGFHNILSLSGDYPTGGGYSGQAEPAFDLDSIGLLEMLNDMNLGLKVNIGKRNLQLSPTEFFMGSVVNNFKLLERELMPQYFKLAKKIATGARFIINQIGYDSRKQDELLKYMQKHDLNVPAIANVYVLNKGTARFFNRGNIPGVIVTDELMALSEKHGSSPDKGKSFFLEFAAKQCAIARGLGFQGCYLGGHLKYDDYEKIFSIIETFRNEDWQVFAEEILFSQKGEFYYFEPNSDSGLSSTEVNLEYLSSKERINLKKGRRKLPILYKMNRGIHEKIFEKESKFFKIGKRVSEKLVNWTAFLQKLTHGTELLIKKTCFDCRDCGDCSLPDIAFLCPESQCVKNQRNGACGGTRPGGKCEIGDKDCIWSLAYDRLKAFGEEDNILKRPTIIKNSGLRGTSAWVNNFLERDNHGKHK